MAGMEVAAKKGLRLRMLTLTSAVNSPDISQSWQAFVKRVRRRGDFEYFQAGELTESGLRHKHIIFASKLYLQQAWISRIWSEIHSAPIVWITAIKHVSRGAGAYVSKYLSKEKGGRYAWSYRWAFHGFVGVWRECKRQFPLSPLPHWKRLLAFMAGGGDLVDVKWFDSRRLIGRESLMIPYGS